MSLCPEKCIQRLGSLVRKNGVEQWRSHVKRLAPLFTAISRLIQHTSPPFPLFHPPSHCHYFHCCSINHNVIPMWSCQIKWRERNKSSSFAAILVPFSTSLPVTAPYAHAVALKILSLVSVTSNLTNKISALSLLMGANPYSTHLTIGIPKFVSSWIVVTFLLPFLCWTQELL